MIPQINVEYLSRGEQDFEEDSPELLKIARQLRQAFSQCGFVNLINHGIRPDLVEKALSNSARFFALPQEEKDSAASTRQSQQGYVGAGREIFDQSEDGSRVIFCLLPYQHCSDFHSICEALFCSCFPAIIESQTDGKSLQPDLRVKPAV